MNNSLKIGIIAGLVAGIVGGITFTIAAKIAISLGFFSPGWHPTLPNAYSVHILLGSIFGIIGGIIYSKAYSLIPGKGILKGLYFGLMLYLISNLRTTSVFWAYGHIGFAWGYAWAGFWVLTVFGIVLGVLYNQSEEKGIKEYSRRSGAVSGVFAGLVGGIAAFVFTIMTVNVGFYPSHLPNFEAFLQNIGTLAAVEIILNVVWGAIFGATYVMFYNRIPGKGVLKGFYFGMLFYLIAIVRPAFLGYAHAAISWAIMLIFVGFFISSSYGLAFGALYKKE